MFAVEAPADVGLPHPAGDVLEVVVGEPEPGPNRRGLREVEHLARRGAPAGQCEQLRRDAEQRVGLHERPVSEAHPKLVRGMHALDHVAEAEACDDQRRVGLDVRAHDEDVARFERLVVGEHAEQNLSENVDLARRAVAAVHLHRAVVGAQRPSVAPHLVGGDVGLQPAQQGVGAVGAGRSREVFVGLRVRRQAALQLAKVAAEGGQQRMADLAVAGVAAAGDLAVHVGERLPQPVAGVRQPQVQIVVGGQRVEEFDLGARQPGVAEQRQPLRQIGR